MRARAREVAGRVRVAVDAEPGSGVEKSRGGAHVDGHIITESFAPVIAARIFDIQMLLLLLVEMLDISVLEHCSACRWSLASRRTVEAFSAQRNDNQIEMSFRNRLLIILLHIASDSGLPT